MTIDQFLSRLDSVRQLGPDEWMARCPAHDDSTPSLHVQLTDDRILIHCFAGCSPQAIVDALGLKLSDLFLDSHSDARGEPGILQAVYTYKDEQGNPLYRVLRYYVPDEKKKTFRQEAWDASSQSWKRTRGAMASVRKVLYRLPELLASPREEPVWLCEGEKDVNVLRMFGLTATTNVGGALAWRPEYNKFLAGRKVYILQDNDETGAKRSVYLAEQLSGIAVEVKVIELPGLGSKEDVSDWLLAGHTVDELREIGEATPPYRQKTVPVMKAEVGLFYLDWPELGIQAEAEVISSSLSDFTILISIYALGRRVLPPTKLNLLALTTRTKLAKDLEEAYPLGVWRAVIDELANRLLEYDREGEPVSVETIHSEEEETRYLIDPLLPLGLPAVLYGDGESGKTLMAILLSTLVSTGTSLPSLGIEANYSGPVLYLDWEANRHLFVRRLKRIAKGLGLEPVVHYLHCTMPLAQDIRRIAKVVVEIDPILIVVDSAALAALSGLHDPLDTVKSLFSPLSQLGRTSLIIAHTPKGSDSIYGSVFFRNLARSVWFAQAFSSYDDEVLDVVLTHNKSNEDRHARPIGIRFKFLGDRIVVRRASPTIPEAKLPKELVIKEFLKREGAATAAEIAQATGINYNTTYWTLKRLVDTGSLIRLPEKKFGLAEADPDIVPF